MSNLRDLKDALSNARKADTTHVRRAFQIYTARPCEFGNVKYERGNYRRPLGDGPHAEPTRADFERFRGYLRAARDHIDETLDAMELHLATDPQLLDVAGMKRAAYAEDLDVSPGSEWLGPSKLPHVAPACASLNMAITQATDCGLLPRDPGVTWNAKAVKPALAAQDDLLMLARLANGGFDIPAPPATPFDYLTPSGEPRTLRAPAEVFSPESMLTPEEAADRARQAAVDAAPSLCVKR